MLCRLLLALVLSLVAGCQDRGGDRPNLAPEIIHKVWRDVAPVSYRIGGERVLVQTLRGSAYGGYTMRVVHECAEPCSFGSRRRRDFADRAGVIVAREQCGRAAPSFDYRVDSYIVEREDGWFTRGQDEGVREFGFICR